VRDVGMDEQSGEVITAPYVRWEGEHVEVTASQAMAATKSPGAKDQAKKFLSDLLASGPMPKTEIEEAADAHCISSRTLYRAKDDLHVIVEKERGVANGRWLWRLPNVLADKVSERPDNVVPLRPIAHDTAEKRYLLEGDNVIVVQHCAAFGTRREAARKFRVSPVERYAQYDKSMIVWTPKKPNSRTRWSGCRIEPNDLMYVTIEKDDSVLFDSRDHIPCDMEKWQAEYDQNAAKWEAEKAEWEQRPESEFIDAGYRRASF
jgi:hypothetical protein